MESIDSLIEAIDAFRGAVMIVTHSEMVLHAVAQKLIVFDGGEVKVFEGTYQDFLERVGWKNEEDISPSQISPELPVPSLNRKNVRRMKAEIMTERTRTIGPLQREISGIEEKITRLEKQIDEDTGKLLEASVKGDGVMINRLSRAIHDAKEEIDALFKNLAIRADDLDTKTRNLRKAERVSEVSKGPIPIQMKTRRGKFGSFSLRSEAFA
jgi:ATP-binding cassette subfamily F protein 3